MRIQEARIISGFKKCDYGSYEDKCQCGKTQNRYNSENYIRTSYEYDEGDYACNKCVIEMAKQLLQKDGE